MKYFSDNFEWMKKISAIYDNPLLRQMESINSKIKIPNFGWLDKINNPTFNNPARELIEVSSHFKTYQSVFKNIDIINSNPLQDIINKLDFRNYDFSELIEGFEDEQEDEFDDEYSAKNIIIDTSTRIKNILFEIFLNNEKLYKISPREFEKVVAELLYHNGFEVELTKQTRDNGFDILALKHLDNLSPIKYLVECKRYAPKRKIGVEIIRSFKEVLQTEQANKGIIVTTSYFSSDAIKKQKETPYLLDYKDKDELISWVDNYYKEKNYG